MTLYSSSPPAAAEDKVTDNDDDAENKHPNKASSNCRISGLITTLSLLLPLLLLQIVLVREVHRFSAATITSAEPGA